jgi:serine/threonine protein kinase
MNCPSQQELIAFHLGKLPSARVEDLAEHVTACGPCSSSLDTLADTSDPLLADLRRPPRPEALSEGELNRAISFVEQMGFHLSLSAEGPGVPGEPLDAIQLGQYRLLDKLGEGGMGAVHKARHTIMGQTVAIKVIHHSRTVRPEAVARFHREIRALAQLDHPNIVRAQYADQAGEIHFLVMEYVEGKSLADLVKERGPLPVAEACEYIRQAAVGLQHAHERGMVHRDVKPSNLLVTPGGQVKVLDLGLALFREDRPAVDELTEAGQVMGTPDYMAPEQWEDTHAVDIRADVYGLGCTLYFLLAGKPPFGGPEYNSLRKKIRAHESASVPPVRESRPDVPAGLAVVLDRMLAKEPGRRYGTPGEVGAALAPFALKDGRQPEEPPTIDASRGPAATADMPAEKPDRRRPRRIRLALDLGSFRVRLALTLAVLLLVVTAMWWQLSPGSRRAVQVADSASKPLSNKPQAVPEPPSVVQAGPNQQQDSRPLALMNERPRVVSFRVGHYRGPEAELVGQIGLNDFSARFDDDVRVHAELEDPAHCLLLAFNPDGKEQLCVPKDPNLPPPLTARLDYPPETNKYFSLTDGTGLQAFVIVASRQPLPPYSQWRPAAPWKAVQADSGWRFHDGDLTPLLQVRGQERERGDAPQALRELCDYFKGRPDVEAVEVLAFPVRKK